MLGKITLKELIQLLNYHSFNNDSYYLHSKNHQNILACICSYSEATKIQDNKSSQKMEAFMFVTDKDNPRLGFTDLMTNIFLENENSVVQVFQNYIQKKLFIQSRFIRFEQITKCQLKDTVTLHIAYQFFGKQKKIDVKLKQKQAEKWKNILQDIRYKKSINFSDKYPENLSSSTQQEQLQAKNKNGLINIFLSRFGNKKQDQQKQIFLNKVDKLFPIQFKKKMIEKIYQKRQSKMQLAHALFDMFKQQMQKIKLQLEKKQKQSSKLLLDLQLKRCQLIENKNSFQQFKTTSQNQKRAHQNKISELQRAKENCQKQIRQLKSQKDSISNKLQETLKNHEKEFQKIVVTLNELKQTLKKKQYEVEQSNCKIKIKQTDYLQLLKNNNILTHNKQILQRQLKQLKRSKGALETQKADIFQDNLLLLSQNQQLKAKLVTSNKQNQQLQVKLSNLNLKNNQLQLKVAISSQQNQKLIEKISKIEQENQKLKQNLSFIQRNLSACQQNLSTCKLNLDQTIIELERQRNNCMQIKKQVQQQHLLHIFGGIVLQNAPHQKHFLKSEIEKCTGKALGFTRLIFKYDPFNPTSFHHYVDEHPNICAVIKLKNGRFIAGFSVSPLSEKTVANQGGIICSLTEKKTYKLCEGKRSVTYDKFFLIFGNSELRLKQGEVKFFTNFGIANSFYDSNGDKYTVLNGAGTEREVIYENFEVFEVFFK